MRTLFWCAFTAAEVTRLHKAHYSNLRSAAVMLSRLKGELGAGVHDNGSVGWACQFLAVCPGASGVSGVSGVAA